MPVLSRLVRGFVGAAVLALATWSLLPVTLAAQVHRAGDAIVDPALPGQGLDVIRRAPDGTVRLAVGRDGGLPMGTAVTGETAASRAARFAAAFGGQLGMAPRSGVQVQRVRKPDTLGIEAVRLQQYIDGIPVTAGELVVQVKGEAVVAVFAEVLSTPPASTDVKITAQAARHTAEGYLAKALGPAAVARYRSTARLEVFNKGLLDDAAAPTRLAWRVETAGVGRQQLTWVDAATGHVLLSFDNQPHALHRHVYNANNGATLPGSIIRDEGGPQTGDVDADAAYLYAGDTWAYYNGRFGRDSFDDTGSTIVSTVHYCPSVAQCPYQNAFWDTDLEQMVYGDTFSLADDVVGHELTHAVTAHEANLLYFAQSGALNESFSDIFGESMDIANAHGNDVGAVRWLLGEDLPVGATRNMMDPTAFGDPAKTSDPTFVCDQNTDVGGVHTNSGVPNHAYALMTDGGTYNNTQISAIGIVKSAKIEYRALTEYLTSGANLRDAYDAVIQACTDFVTYGLDGVTQNDCASVQWALQAVEMDETPGCSVRAPRLCPLGQAVQTVTHSDFDSSLAGWTPSVTWDVTPHNEYVLSGAAAWSDDPNVTADGRLTQNTPVALPANARVQFSHAYGFESWGSSYFDGAIFEYSTNNGSTWTQVGNAWLLGGQGYDGMIESYSGNPLGGLEAFVGSSLGYTASQYDLGALGGQSVQFRFRVGSDVSYGWLGWYVDDFIVYTCRPTTPGDFVGTTGIAQASVVHSTPGGLSWMVNGSAPVIFGQSGDIAVPADYDGDGATDIATFRDGTWRIRGGATVGFGGTGDIPVPGDYDGDGKAEMAVYLRAYGAYFVEGQGARFVGAPGDIPLPGDYDGDGRTDPGVFRPSTGQWFFLFGAVNYYANWGMPGDIPVPADYDGDGVTDVALFRPSDGTWRIWNGSAAGTYAWGQKGMIPVPLNVTGSAAADLVAYQPSTATWNVKDLTGGTSTFVWGNPGDPPAMLRPLVLATPTFDVDRDLKTDLGVFRPSNGTWYILSSITKSSLGARFGLSTDVPMAADYDGDGLLDAAVYRPSNGTWYTLLSSTNWATGFTRQFGIATDKPLAADYDGDGRADLAVYRPSTGTWYVNFSHTNWNGSGVTKRFGTATDIPLAADFDGDGKAEIAVFRPGAQGTWYVLRSTTLWTTSFSRAYGTTGDIPVAADYDGDRRADLAVYRGGTWYWAKSSTNYAVSMSVAYGLPTDIPVPGDYDADGIADTAVFRPSNGTWYARNVLSFRFGTAGDVPLPRRP